VPADCCNAVICVALHPNDSATNAAYTSNFGTMERVIPELGIFRAQSSIANS